MPSSTLQERVQKLKNEFAQLRGACEMYHKIRHHSVAEMKEQRQRALRLQQIVDELASLTKKRAE